MTQRKWDYVDKAYIGYNATHKTTINCIYWWADNQETPESEGEVEPINTINRVRPVGVSGTHKYWKILLVLDTNNIEAIYSQQVENGDSDSRAIREDADNDPIGYFVVKAYDVNGNLVTITYESGTVYCVDEEEEFDNEEGVERQLTTLEFTCIGTRTETVS